MSITGCSLLLVGDGLADGGVLDVLGVGLGGVVGHAFVALLDLGVFGFVGGLAVGGAHAGEVDPQFLGGAQEVVVFVAHLGAGALFGDHVDVQRQRLHLLQEDLEGF